MEALGVSRTPTSNNTRGNEIRSAESVPPNKKHFSLSEIYKDNKLNEAEEAPPTELFGLCPGSTKAGDFLCIIYGCSVPVILRPIDDFSNKGPRRLYKGKDIGCSQSSRYSVVGEAYVHGKMDGEAIDTYLAAESSLSKHESSPDGTKASNDIAKGTLGYEWEFNLI
ncbi:hypothetical protein TWF730_004436 [Orbilia blumenaviensis]|uniref:Uncharacterized protein n=1 Tax=Orbilia blumenaviensis TaxID=1796055 RepID=A0AAV9TYH0_9PEZI